MPFGCGYGERLKHAWLGFKEGISVLRDLKLQQRGCPVQKDEIKALTWKQVAQVNLYRCQV